MFGAAFTLGLVFEVEAQRLHEVLFGAGVALFYRLCKIKIKQHVVVFVK